MSFLTSGRSSTRGVEALERRLALEAPLALTDDGLVLSAPEDGEAWLDPGITEELATADSTTTSSYTYSPPPSYPMPTFKPTVGVTGGGGSENGRAPALFTVSRSGSMTGALDVYFSVGGSATAGSVNADGTLTPDADYVLSAQDYKVTIPDGAATATVTGNPFNDSRYEGTETIDLVLASAASYNIDAAKANALVELKGLNVKEVGVEEDPPDENNQNPRPTDGELDALIADLDDADPEVVEAAMTALINDLRDYPSLEAYFDKKLLNLVDELGMDDDPTVVGLRGIQNSHPNRYQVCLRHMGNNKLAVMVREPAPIGEMWEITVTTLDPVKCDLVVGNERPRNSVIVNVGAGKFFGEQIEVVTKNMEDTELQVNFRRVTNAGEHVVNSSGHRLQKLVMAQTPMLANV